MEQQSGWEFGMEDDGNTITVTATCKDGGNPPVRFIYTGQNDFKKQEVTLYTQFRTLEPRTRFNTWESVYCWKSSARAADLAPWVAENRQKHGLKVKEQGIKAVVGELAFTHALTIIWQGCREGYAERHRQKSQAKDKKDQDRELF
jgi:hypothetical protein